MPCISRDSTILMRLRGSAPILWLAMSVNRAVAVHDRATMSDIISPVKYTDSLPGREGARLFPSSLRPLL